MPEAQLPKLLDRLAQELRRALGPQTALVLTAQHDCPACRYEPAALEEALIDMVRRVRDASPQHSTLRVCARACEGGMALSVSSDCAEQVLHLPGTQAPQAALANLEAPESP